MVAAPPSTAVARRRLPVGVLSVLAAAVFAANTTEVLPVGLLPQISRDLQVSQSRVGLLVSAYAVVVALGSVPLTALAARWPRRRVLGVLLVLYAVSNGVFAGTDSYWVALVARLFGGLAHAGFFAVVVAAAAEVAPRESAGRAVAFVMGGGVVALTFGVPLGTALGAAFGWRWAFAGGAAIMAVLAWLTVRAMPSTELPPAHTADQSVLTAARSPALLRVAATLGLLLLGHYTLYTYVTPLLREAGVHTQIVSVALFGYGAAGIIGLGLAGTLADRNPRRGLVAAAALTVACLLGLGLAHHSVAVTITLVVIWGAAFGSLPTLAQNVALRAAPGTPDAAPAVVNTTFNVGIAGGALVGSRELLVAAPWILALTAAGISALCFVLLAGLRLAPSRR